MTPPADGSRISHYRITAELGRDALGRVVQAVDDMLDRPVALKVVRALEAYPADLASTMRGRFMQAAQRAARVVHPNVVTLYGYQQLGELDILSMELVEGDTVHARLARGERWPAMEAAALIARVADGVAAAHAAGVVHGNLRLRNVKLRADGRVKILDLGVPKASTTEVSALIAQAAGIESAAVTHATAQQDVVALARMTCHLITGALRFTPGGTPADPPAQPLAEPLFPDPRRVLQNLGVLAPVIERALRGDDGGYADAGEFRDALLGVIETAGRPQPADPAEREAVLELPLPGGEGAPRDRAILDAEGALSPLERFAGDAHRPALVLPADLASRARPPQAGTYVVMGEDNVAARARHMASDVVRRLGTGRRRRIVIAASAVGVLLVGAILVRELASGGASAATIEEPARTEVAAQAPTPSAGEPSTVATDTLTGVLAAADTGFGVPLPGSDEEPAIAAPPDHDGTGPIRTARVRGTPAGTAISPIGQGGGPWLETAELSVAAGDSIVLRFVRPGYVARSAVFRGEPLTVALRPDSVTVNFETNVEAEVFVAGGTDPAERPLGRAPLTARLPTGVHRITFRAPFQEDWGTTAAFETAGRTHTVQKMDYETTGDVVATVGGGWAWVSVDGGEEFETPHRFSSVPIGRHVIRLRRDGFRAVVDTVLVRGGQTLTKQYTLQR